MKGMLVFLVVVLAVIISFVAGEYNPVLGMAMVQPFLIIALFLVLLILYMGFCRFFNKKENEKIIEKSIETEKEKSSSSHEYSDLYLMPSIVTNDLIEYQIVNKEKVMLWSGRCNFNQGKIHSITLCSVQENKEMVLQVSEKIAGREYLVKDKQSSIGSIKITDNGLHFNNINNVLIYTAIPDIVGDEGLGPVVDWVIALDTLQPFSSSSKCKFFTLKGEGNEVLGKYYISLRNIDVTFDRNNKLDKGIAAVLSMFLDSTLTSNPSK